MAKSEKLLERMHKTAVRLEGVMHTAEASQDWRTVIQAARELRPWLALMARTFGEIEPSERNRPGDAHALASEARRFLSWYEQHVGQRTESASSEGFLDAESFGSNRVYDLPDPHEDSP